MSFYMYNFSFAFIAILSFFHQKDIVCHTSPAFNTYCNARFDYCIYYPNNLLYPQPEAENGDGRVFKNKAGKTILTVYGRINQDGEVNAASLQQQFDEDAASFKTGALKGTITYKKLGKGFYVISGFRNGNIFYQKTIAKKEAFCFALLEYDPAEKAVYDGIAGEIFKSFK